MAETTLFSIPRPGKIDSLVLDAVIQETHSYTNTITSHPVETGFDVSDHSRPEPDKITLECVVTSTPLDGSDSQVDEQRVADALAKLDDLRMNGTLVTVVTSLKQYSSMGVESITVTRDVKTGAALKFTAALKFVRVVSNKLTKVAKSKSKSAASKVKHGAAKETPATVDQDTALLKTTGAVAGALK